MQDLNLKNVTLKGSQGYLLGSGAFARTCEHKLSMTFEELLKAEDGIVEGEEFELTDKAIPSLIYVKLVITDE